MNIQVLILRVLAVLLMIVGVVIADYSITAFGLVALAVEVSIRSELKEEAKQVSYSETK